jgi:hypothetical protein
MSETVEPAKMSEEQTLVFRGKLTEQDVVDLHRHRDLLMLRKGLRYLGIGLMFGLIALAALGLVIRKDNQDLLTPLVGLGFFLVCAYLVVVYYPLRRRTLIRRHYRKHAADYHETTVTISPDRIRIDNPSIQSDFDWKHVCVIAETVDGLLFCSHTLDVHFWLPSRLLTAESRQLALEWAVRNNVQIRNL